MTQDAIGQHKLLEGKYLVFILAGEHYGIEIGRVQEIINLPEVTRIPNLPHFVRGIINLRGHTVPAIELRKKFGIDATEDTDKTCIIVIDFEMAGGKISAGIIVDEVAEVMDLAEEHLAEVPEFEIGKQAHFVKGVGLVDNQITMLIDVGNVLGMEDLEALGAVSGDINSATEAEQNEQESAGNGDISQSVADDKSAEGAAANLDRGVKTGDIDGKSSPVMVGHITNLMGELTPGTKEHDAAATLLQNLQVFLETMDGVESAELEKLLAEIDSANQPLFQELGKLVRNLHQQIKLVSTDIPARLGEMAEHDMVSATQRLEHVVEMTEKAANVTIGFTEELMEAMAENETSDRAMLGKVDQALTIDGLSPDVKGLLEETAVNLQARLEFDASTQGKLTEVLMAQGYQDLTGQVVQKIVTLLNQLEDELLELVKVFGRAHGKKSVMEDPSSNVVLQGPLSEKSEKGDLKRNQDEVDDLLQSLGF